MRREFQFTQYSLAELDFKPLTMLRWLLAHLTTFDRYVEVAEVTLERPDPTVDTVPYVEDAAEGIIKYLKKVSSLGLQELLDARYKKYRSIGEFIENK